MNCGESVEKKVLQWLLSGEQRKRSPTTEGLCFVAVVVLKAKWRMIIRIGFKFIN